MLRTDRLTDGQVHSCNHLSTPWQGIKNKGAVSMKCSRTDTLLKDDKTDKMVDH